MTKDETLLKELWEIYQDFQMKTGNPQAAAILTSTYFSVTTNKACTEFLGVELGPIPPKKGTARGKQ